MNRLRKMGAIPLQWDFFLTTLESPMRQVFLALLMGFGLAGTLLPATAAAESMPSEQSERLLRQGLEKFAHHQNDAACKLIKASADLNNPYALYAYGYGCRKGKYARAYYYAKAAEMGHPGGALWVGMIYGDPSPFEISSNRDRMVRWITFSAEQGYNGAKHALNEVHKNDMAIFEAKLRQNYGYLSNQAMMLKARQIDRQLDNYFNDLVAQQRRRYY